MNSTIDWLRFSKHFKEAMSYHKHSVRTLAKMWECSPTTIANLRSGKPASSELFLTACFYASQSPMSYWSTTK